MLMESHLNNFYLKYLKNLMYLKYHYHHLNLKFLKNLKYHLNLMYLKNLMLLLV